MKSLSKSRTTEGQGIRECCEAEIGKKRKGPVIDWSVMRRAVRRVVFRVARVATGESFRTPLLYSRSAVVVAGDLQRNEWIEDMFWRQNCVVDEECDHLAWHSGSPSSRDSVF